MNTIQPPPLAPSTDKKASGSRLRLYIARSTPNSIRAEQNLRAALDNLEGQGQGLEIEIVDVFTQPKRAITDGVIVTPTLIAIRDGARMTMMGDLTDTAKLSLLLTSLEGATF